MPLLLLPSAGRLAKPLPSVPLNPAHPLARGLVGYWPFAESGGSRGQDLSRQGNAATLVSATWVPTPLGSLPHFSGSSGSYAEVLSRTTYDLPTGTIVCWMRSSQAVNFVLIHARSTSGSVSCILMFADNSGTGPLRVQVKDSAANTRADTTGTINLLDGQLHQVAFSWSGQASGSAWAMYTDGRLQTSGTFSGAWAFGGSVLRWGVALDAFWTPLNGEVGPTCWYNRPLVASEIAQLYRRPFSLLAPPAWQLWPSDVPATTTIPPGLGPAIGMDTYMQAAGALVWG